MYVEVHSVAELNYPLKRAELKQHGSGSKSLAYVYRTEFERNRSGSSGSVNRGRI